MAINLGKLFKYVVTNYGVVYLFKKKVKGLTYYYLGESKRVGGKPVRAWEIYLGTAERLRKIAESGKVVPDSVEVLEFGGVAGVLCIAELLNIVRIIDEVVTKRNQGLSVGWYILLIAINRCVEPVSKNEIGQWLEKTFLPEYLKLEKCPKSQDFWNHMDYMEDEHIDAIEKKLCEKLIALGVSTEHLLYDPTNFATFLVDHEGNKLAQRGNNKKKRFDLRQISVALLVTTDFSIPLLHETYEGNRNDAKKFPEIISKLVERFKLFSQDTIDITIVFDKGNNSKTNLKILAESGYHFVGSLKPYNYKKYLEIPLEKFEPVIKKEDSEILAFRFRDNIFGVDRTVVITFEKRLYLRNKATQDNKIAKIICHLEELKAMIGTPRCKTRKTIERKLRKIIDENDIVHAYLTEKNGEIKLNYEVIEGKYREIEKGFGKNILFTDNENWSTEEIIRAYRSLYKIEHSFRQMNDKFMVSIQPIYHWTDQKIKVHVFACILALLLISLLKRELHKSGIDLSTHAIMEKLTGIRKIALVYKDSSTKILTKMSKEQKQMFDVLKLDAYA